MLRTAPLTSALAATLLLAACSASTGPDAPSSAAVAPSSSGGELTIDNFSADRLRADVEFLADDLLKGRDTGSEGYLMAANYVAATYKRLGIKPMGEDGGYFQTVNFATATNDPDNSALEVTVGGETKTLMINQDFLMGGDTRKLAADVTGEVVFAGYGVHAPEQGYSDFEGVDLEGKIALVMRGTPDSLNSEVRSHFGQTASKALALKEAGAIGWMVMDTRATAERFPWDRRTPFGRRGSFDWVAPNGDAVNENLIARASVSFDVVEMLLDGSGVSLDDVLDAQADGTMKAFETEATARIKKTTVLSNPISSPNVIGMIPGADPELRDEYVVLSAHLDHVGVNENAKGDDKIYNGAMDNATGSSVLLEVARAFMLNGIKPRRSILLVSVTAEEKGLLGAEYFAHFPTMPEGGEMVANVNLDMPILLYNFADVVAFGAEHSSLGPITRAAAAKAGIAVTPDPIPEQNLFVRSDHYRFVQQGIPSVFLMTGFLETEDGQIGGDVFWGFLTTQYHSPQDQPDLPINYQAGAKFAFVNFLIANEIANADQRPAWNEGNFFGNTFGGGR